MALFDKYRSLKEYEEEIRREENYRKQRSYIDENKFFEELKRDGADEEIIEVKREEMNKEVQDRKRWCERYINLKRSFDIYCDEVEYYRTKQQQLTKYLTGMPGGSISRQDNYWVEVMEKLDMIGIYLKDLSDRMITTCAEINTAINKLEDSEESILLTMKYIYNDSWKEICKHFKKSKRSIMYIHRRALLHLDIIQAEIKPPNLRYPSDYFFHTKGVTIGDIMEEEPAEEFINENRKRLSYLDTLE